MATGTRIPENSPIPASCHSNDTPRKANRAVSAAAMPRARSKSTPEVSSARHSTSARISQKCVRLHSIKKIHRFGGGRGPLSRTGQRQRIVPETGCPVRGWPECHVAWFTKAISRRQAIVRVSALIDVPTIKRSVTMKNLKNKVAVVTGAGSGIGRALARSLADRGCRLALSDVNEAGLAETAEALKNADVKTYRLDVSDRDAIFAHAEEVVKDFGQVNLVINNAGVALSATVREMTDEDFKWVMDIDFWGVAHGTRAFLPHLIASGDGHVVNVSSVFGLIGVPKQSAYNAAKFAVRGFTEALRQEMKLENQPVAVSCVHPGGIRTNIANAARMGKSENAVAQRKGFDKLAMTTPEKAAETVVKGILKNESRILEGPDARGIDAINRLLGSAYQPLVERFSRKNLYI